MKIAICFYGLVGGDKGKGGEGDSQFVLEKSYESYKKHFLDKFNPDIYLHTWDINLENEIYTLYKPYRAIYEKQKVFDIPGYVKGDEKRKQNHYSRWYSTWQATNLVEHDYDYVMLTRFDLTFNKSIDFTKLQSDILYVSGWNKIMYRGEDIFKGGRGSLYDKPELYKKAEDKLKGYPHDKDGLLDHWFIGSTSTIKNFGSLYKHLDEYNKDCTDSDNNISNHQLALYHCQHENIPLDFIGRMYNDWGLTRRLQGCRL